MKGEFVYSQKEFLNLFKVNFNITERNIIEQSTLIKLREIREKSYFSELKSTQVSEKEAIEGYLSQSNGYIAGLVNKMDENSFNKKTKRRILKTLTEINNFAVEEMYIKLSKSKNKDGKLLISKELDNGNDLKFKIEAKILIEEQELIKDKELLKNEKEKVQLIFESFKLSIIPVFDFIYDNNSLKSANGLFSLLKEAFSHIATAIITTITVVVETAIGIVAGFAAGNLVGAFVGGVLGFIGGIETGIYFSCQWFFDDSWCQECQTEFPESDFPCSPIDNNSY